MNNQTQNFGEAIKFYADRQKDKLKRTALNVQYVETKGKTLSVNVEMAIIPVNSTKADWDHKVVVQLSIHELADVCSTLFGLKREVRANYHGDNRNKGITVINNGSKGASIQLSEAGSVMQHLLSHQQRVELGVFIIRRLAMAWQISVSDTLAILRQSVVLERQSFEEQC